MCVSALTPTGNIDGASSLNPKNKNVRINNVFAVARDAATNTWVQSRHSSAHSNTRMNLKLLYLDLCSSYFQFCHIFSKNILLTVSVHSNSLLSKSINRTVPAFKYVSTSKQARIWVWCLGWMKMFSRTLKVLCKHTILLNHYASRTCPNQ
jgi:hypothetical protein